MISHPKLNQQCVTRLGSRGGAFVEATIYSLNPHRHPPTVDVRIGTSICMVRFFNEIWEVDEGLRLALQEAAGQEPTP